MERREVDHIVFWTLICGYSYGVQDIKIDMEAADIVASVLYSVQFHPC